MIGGESEASTIRLFCDLLGLILTPEDRACSIGLTDHHRAFESYIFLQAFVGFNLDEVDVQGKALVNPFPLAMINITVRTVHMSASVQDHIFKKQFSMTGLPITVRSVGKFVENPIRSAESFNQYAG